MGSSARLRKKTTRSSAPVSSNCCRKKAASRFVMPIAANTMANSSPDLTRAWRMICAASSLAGRPEPEKIGSFWPRTSVFRPSIDADAGLDEVGRLLARVRVDRRAGDVEARLGDDRRAAVDRLAGAVEHAAEQLDRDVDLGDLFEEADLGLGDVDAVRALEDLDDGRGRRRPRAPGRSGARRPACRIETISL